MHAKFGNLRRFPIHGRSESDIRKMVFGGLEAECVLSIQLPGDVQLIDIFVPRILSGLQTEEGNHMQILPQNKSSLLLAADRHAKQKTAAQGMTWDIATDGQKNSSTTAKLSSSAAHGSRRTYRPLPATTLVRKSQVSVGTVLLGRLGPCPGRQQQIKA